MLCNPRKLLLAICISQIPLIYENLYPYSTTYQNFYQHISKIPKCNNYVLWMDSNIPLPPCESSSKCSSFSPHIGQTPLLNPLFSLLIAHGNPIPTNNPIAMRITQTKIIPPFIIYSSIILSSIFIGNFIYYPP